MIDEQETTREHIESLKGSIDFFSPERKHDRELWIAGEFLRALGIDFEPHELESVEDDPPDVKFRGAMFETKEILDEGRERHKEYKDALQKSKSAKSLDELFEPYRPLDLPLSDIVHRIDEALAAYTVDAATANKLDLLFYVNLQDIGKFSDDDHSAPYAWKRWRSVSMVVNGGIALVFCSEDEAPDFIRRNIGRLVQNMS